MAGSPKAARSAERLVSADPLDEAAARRLMHLRYLQGERAAALAVYDRFAAALAEALEAKPARSTCELRETIRAAPAPQPIARRDIPTSLLRRRASSAGLANVPRSRPPGPHDAPSGCSAKPAWARRG
jgi:DNA-binding SARP family transcriptional activator